MIGPFVARVGLRSCRNCLMSVSQHMLPTNPTNHIVTFHVHDDQGLSLYFSWSGEVTSSFSPISTHNGSSRNSLIEINGFYALKLGLYDGQEVLVEHVSNVVQLECINAEPIAVDDWEILELHTDYIQANLLNQVRVVWNGQILPVWVEQSVCIFIRISNLVPDCQVGLLEQMTEVHVSPKSRTINPQKPIQRTNYLAIDSQIESLTKEKNTDTSCDILSVEDSSVDTSTSKDWGTLYNRFFKDTFKKWRFGNHNAMSGVDETSEVLSVSHFQGISNFKLKLRVQSTDLFNDVFVNYVDEDFFDTQRLFTQPNTAFVLSSSLPIDIGRPFTIARLSRVMSMNELSEKEPHSKANIKKFQFGNSSSHDNMMKSHESKTQLEEIGLKRYIKVIIVDVLCSHVQEHLGNNDNVISKLVEIMVPGVVYLSDSIRQHLRCEITSRVAMQFGDHTLKSPKSINLSPITNMDPGVSEAVLHLEIARWLSLVCSTRCPIVATNRSILKIDTESCIEQQFEVTSGMVSEAEEVMLITPSVNLNIKLDDVKKVQLPTLFEVPVIGCKSAAIGGMDDLIHRGMTFLKASLGLGPLSKHLKPNVDGSASDGCLLICGQRGSGKTTLAKSLCRELTDTIYRVHCSYVACKSMKGKRVESVYRVWTRTFQEAIYRAPSVVLLDDLDHLTGSLNGPENEAGGAANYNQRMSHAFLDILKAIRLSCNASVVVVATSLSPASLHPTLASSQGVHIFQDILDIKIPTPVQRKAILQCLLLSKTIISSESLNNIDWHLVLARTEGFVAHDLDMLLDRAVHVAYSKLNSDDLEILLSDDELKVALENFVPASLRGLQLQKNYNKGWNDIGGLHNVKQSLIETFQWPSLYPEIFLHSPLPLRSGVLLYGPPGTGKTLLASAVAKECKMNFISIKGPELLSKYIGASEQSVRDLFQRAANAKPCIIFFDEFDSLATKRGNDSTGVTDRVVNQILTQMDGVEGRQGVYILAATSRPDLIDPALLRPGRFDQSLCCSMPSLEERVEILKALAISVKLFGNVDLIEIATLCHNFSGADLQGLLCNAQLKAIHRLDRTVKRDVINTEFTISEENHTIFLPSLEEGISTIDNRVAFDKIETQVDTIFSNAFGCQRRRRHTEASGDNPMRTTNLTNTTTITREDLLDALADMKPSVSNQERQRYEIMFIDLKYRPLVGLGDSSPMLVSLATKRVLVPIVHYMEIGFDDASDRMDAVEMEIVRQSIMTTQHIGDRTSIYRTFRKSRGSNLDMTEVESPQKTVEANAKRVTLA